MSDDLKTAYPLQTVDEVHDWHNAPDWMKRDGDEECLPIPNPTLCAENLRDDGFHPEATCVERMADRIEALEAQLAAEAKLDKAVGALMNIAAFGRCNFDNIRVLLAELEGKSDD